MRAAGDLQPPVGYDDRWVLLAVAAVLVVAAYYAAAWWVTRPRTPRPSRRDPQAARADCLATLDRIERAAASHELAPRDAHQQVSQVVRGFVSASGGERVATMTLGELRREGPERLADLVAVLYPPEFGPDEDEARRRLGASLARARELVSTWS